MLCDRLATDPRPGPDRFKLPVWLGKSLRDKNFKSVLRSIYDRAAWHRRPPSELRPTCEDLRPKEDPAASWVTRKWNRQGPRPFLTVNRDRGACRFQWLVSPSYCEYSGGGENDSRRMCNAHFTYLIRGPCQELQTFANQLLRVGLHVRLRIILVNFTSKLARNKGYITQPADAKRLPVLWVVISVETRPLVALHWNMTGLFLPKYHNGTTMFLLQIISDIYSNGLVFLFWWVRLFTKGFDENTIGDHCEAHLKCQN